MYTKTDAYVHPYRPSLLGRASSRLTLPDDTAILDSTIRPTHLRAFSLSVIVGIHRFIVVYDDFVAGLIGGLIFGAIKIHSNLHKVYSSRRRSSEFSLITSKVH